MRTDLFDFDLPADRIALRPVVPRDAARLLVVRPGQAPVRDDRPSRPSHTPLIPAQAGIQQPNHRDTDIRPSVPAFAGTSGGSIHDLPSGDVLEDRTIADLPDLLAPGDALVINDSRVIAARLKGRRIGRGAAEPEIEATLHKRLDGSHWRAFILGAKKVQVGDTLRFGVEGRVCFLGELDAQVSQKDEGGEVTLSFSFHGPVLDQAIAERGDMPLPPYIASRRAPDERDRVDYQTVFAKPEGSVAAPTAGLHFTEPLIDRLKARGVAVHAVTLHVGAGTFLPVKSDDTEHHRMHAEFGTVSAGVADALNAVRASGGRIVPVGSTALRLLEAAAGEDGRLQAFSGETAIFITPGYGFRAADLMLTNFHLPRSTLFMLVAAFSGLETMKRAYAHAIAAGYRFYSYGDACLLYPQMPRVPDAAQREA
jgi:S-adenosylmethionine:tRNA ribosyltransferase-isomerase